MITPDYVRLMARYNRWQNRNLYGAADGLTDADRRASRGAYFGSIHATLSHLLWGDRMWLSRFADMPAPAGGIQDSVSFIPEWAALKAERAVCDEAILAFAAAAPADVAAGDLTWYSGSAGRNVTRPRAQLLLHMFNHQTHHRGQVHAMLTAAGARPGVTDLAFLPDDA